MREQHHHQERQIIQLEEEILQNGWLTTPATHKILFETNHVRQYEAALASLGISEELLSAESGHA